MTIKELIDNYGGVTEFRRFLEKQQKMYSKIPTCATLYEHYKGKRVTNLNIKDIYKSLGVCKF